MPIMWYPQNISNSNFQTARNPPDSLHQLFFQILLWPTWAWVRNPRDLSSLTLHIQTLETFPPLHSTSKSFAFLKNPSMGLCSCSSGYKFALQHKGCRFNPCSGNEDLTCHEGTKPVLCNSRKAATAKAHNPQLRVHVPLQRMCMMQQRSNTAKTNKQQNISSVQFSHVQLFATPWTAAHQASPVHR